jgi:putative N-acetyltransferase (TIGR04045 family)
MRSDGQSPSSRDAIICRLARTADEQQAYFALRREIFCREQQLFAGDDHDAWDEGATPIVCLHGAGDSARVVGVVRIWETAQGDWWGGRLGVHQDFRTAATVGRRLVQTAVGTARAWGAWRFRATVQQANVAFVRRLHWRTLQEIELLAQPHHLMEADLGRYAPTTEVRPAGSVRSRDAA